MKKKKGEEKKKRGKKKKYLREAESLLDNRGELTDADGLVTEDVLGAGGVDDDLGGGGGNTDLWKKKKKKEVSVGVWETRVRFVCFLFLFFFGGF